MVITESLSLLLQHWDLALQLCEDLGIVVNWEWSDLHLSTLVQYLGMLIDTSLEKVFSSEARVSSFRDVRLPSWPFCHPQHACGSSCWVTWLHWRGFSLEVTQAYAVVPQGPLVPYGGRSCHSDPSVAGMRGGSSFVAPGGPVGVWCPSPGS